MYENINDELLLRECKLAVQTEKQSTARVLEYLCAIDDRRLWLKEGFSSLFDFCLRFLNYSEGETYRRIQACRLSSRVKEVKPLLENNSLSLTTMSLLSPLLDSENAKDILPKVINQPTREVERVLQEHFPEKAKKSEVFKVELDIELKGLLEEARTLASEKEPQKLLKKVLRDYLRNRKTRASSVKAHTRYVPQPIAREVSPKGLRCNQRAHLQIDHIRPYAKGGSSHDIDNLRCLCKAHNLFLAKRDFPKFFAMRKYCTPTASQTLGHS
jgi:hypothetical protein